MPILPGALASVNTSVARGIGCDTTLKVDGEEARLKPVKKDQ
jgi:hypothetical protein